MPDRSRPTLQQFHSVNSIEVSRRINLLEGNLRAVCEPTAWMSWTSGHDKTSLLISALKPNEVVQR